MKLLLTSICLLLAAPAFTYAGDAKPEKKTIRAADGLNLVCEVRGKGARA